MKKLLVLLIFFSSMVQANCIVYFNKGPLEQPMHDPLFLLLSQAVSCPDTIQPLRKLLNQNEINEQISMVANRGRNNPDQGSFSFFESIHGRLLSGELIDRGDLFLGYFTGLQGKHIILDQQPEDRKLVFRL